MSSTKNRPATNPGRLLVLLAVAQAMLVALPASAQAQAPEEPITNPFEWCVAHEDTRVLAPDPNTAMGKAVISAAQQQGLARAGTQATEASGIRWRCMQGELWVCQIGANLPCEQRADTSREPLAAVIRYCRERPDSVVPANVTGRASVYAWECSDTLPVISRQLFTPDSAGYLSEFWTRLASPPPVPD